MSEEQTEEVEQVEEKPEKGRPASLPEDQEWEKVDFATADAETIQRRFNRVYASTKMTEAALKQAAEDNRKLAERLEAFERKQQEESAANRLSSLKAEKKKAMEEGETDRVIEIDDEILNLKTAPKPEPPKKEEPEPTWFTPQRQRVLEQWAGAMTDDGEYKRPWAQPDHPKNARCIEITNGVLNDPDFAGAEMDEILSEVDRLMAPRPKKPAQSPVLSGGTAPRENKKGAIKLTEEEKLVARKMYNDMDPNEAIKRYAASVAQIRGNA